MEAIEMLAFEPLSAPQVAAAMGIASAFVAPLAERTGTPAQLCIPSYRSVLAVLDTAAAPVFLPDGDPMATLSATATDEDRGIDELVPAVVEAAATLRRRLEEPDA
jgi:hypothetical protein